MVAYSSRQAAKKLGITAAALSQYIKLGKVPAPKTVQVGRLRVQSWSEAEVEALRQLLPKIANGRKTRYKKKQSALSSQQSGKAKAQAGVPQPRQAKRLSGTPVPVPHKEKPSRKKK